MTLMFCGTLKYRSIFQKVFGLSPPDLQRLQTIWENSVLLIFNVYSGFTRFYTNFLTYHTDPKIYSMTPIIRATLKYRSNFQKIFG